MIISTSQPCTTFCSLVAPMQLALAHNPTQAEGGHVDIYGLVLSSADLHNTRLPPRTQCCDASCADGLSRWTSSARTLKVSWKMPNDLFWRMWERMFTQTGKCSREGALRTGMDTLVATSCIRVTCSTASTIPKCRGQQMCFHLAYSIKESIERQYCTDTKGLHK